MSEFVALLEAAWEEAARFVYPAWYTRRVPSVLREGAKVIEDFRVKLHATLVESVSAALAAGDGSGDSNISEKLLKIQPRHFLLVACKLLALPVDARSKVDAVLQRLRQRFLEVCQDPIKELDPSPRESGLICSWLRKALNALETDWKAYLRITRSNNPTLAAAVRHATSGSVTQSLRDSQTFSDLFGSQMWLANDRLYLYPTEYSFPTFNRKSGSASGTAPVILRGERVVGEDAGAVRQILAKVSVERGLRIPVKKCIDAQLVRIGVTTLLRREFLSFQSEQAGWLDRLQQDLAKTHEFFVKGAGGAQASLVQLAETPSHYHRLYDQLRKTARKQVLKKAFAYLREEEIQADSTLTVQQKLFILVSTQLQRFGQTAGKFPEDQQSLIESHAAEFFADLDYFRLSSFVSSKFQAMLTLTSDALERVASDRAWLVMGIHNESEAARAVRQLQEFSTQVEWHVKQSPFRFFLQELQRLVLFCELVSLQRLTDPERVSGFPVQELQDVLEEAMRQVAERDDSHENAYTNFVEWVSQVFAFAGGDSSSVFLQRTGLFRRVQALLQELGESLTLTRAPSPQDLRVAVQEESLAKSIQAFHESQEKLIQDNLGQFAAKASHLLVTTLEPITQKAQNLVDKILPAIEQLEPQPSWLFDLLNQNNSGTLALLGSASDAGQLVKEFTVPFADSSAVDTSFVFARWLPAILQAFFLSASFGIPNQ